MNQGEEIGQSNTGTAALDYTQIQEDSMDESQGTTEDLNHTLQEELALRKNLDDAFADAQLGAKSSGNEGKPRLSSLLTTAGTAPSRPSMIQQKIAHFERKLAENDEKQKQQHAAVKPPPAPRVIDNKRAAARQSLQVFLRIRPCEATQESFVSVVPPPNINIAAGEVQRPTKIRTHPANDSSEVAPTTAYSRGKKDTTKEFEFTQVFEEDTTQVQLYERTAAPFVNQLCSGNRVGKSALLFCYGITNAGKTHTVLGDVRIRNKNAEKWGIVPRCLAQILQKVSNTDLKVNMSYFEIYNENVFDLLPKTSKKNIAFHVNAKPLKIRERHGQTIIKGLTKHRIKSFEHGLQVVRKAKESRHTATNHLNRNSSRSHCVCQLTVSLTEEPEAQAEDDSSVDTNRLFAARPKDSATLWIVDLAGSERSKRTNVGSLRQKEASYINKSLMTLMGCLTRGEKNYRDSKLTVLFMHHWMKAGATSMIVNIHPAREDYDETQHVLAYAISTKTIPNPERAIASADLSSQPEYGYDGHRKKAAKQNPERPKGDRSQLARKRKSTMLVSADSKPTFPMQLPKAFPLDETTKAKKQKHDVDEIDPTAFEVETLRARCRALEEKLELTETSVRAEVADEMLKEMTATTQRHEATIRELKAQLAETRQNSIQKKNLEQAFARVEELTEQVKECEEEMARMTERHARDQRLVLEEKASLAEELEACRSEIVNLKKTKEELVRNYETLLSDQGEEEDSEDVSVGEAYRSPNKKGLGHYTKQLKCRTEPRPRRPLAIRTADATPFKKQKLTTQPAPTRVIGETQDENARSSGPMSASQKAVKASNQRKPLANRSVNVVMPKNADKKTRPHHRVEHEGTAPEAMV